MKKLIVLFASILMYTFAQAQTTIHVVWPFSISSSDSVMVRSLIDGANSQQTKYRFVFLSKQGAGGTVAASYVHDNPDNHVLISSSSFYVRPMLYKESHDPEKFAMVGAVCNGKPLAIFSKKYTTVKDIGTNEFTVGINSGSITQLVSRGLKNNSNIKVLEIPYKGTPEATVDMLGGHLDGSVDFIGISTFAKFPPNAKVNVLGITGTVSQPGLPTFKSQGVLGLEYLTANYSIFVSATIPVHVQQELNQIFNSAVNQGVRDNCEEDYGKIVKVPYSQTAKLHQESIGYWRKITTGMSKE
jgi:tripartite-type tricarboxylate transporter receptor subunit TctC